MAEPTHPARSGLAVITACVLASLSTKAPQRAIRIAEKALAYVQRTKALDRVQ